jgi:hypothetical protein
VAMLPGDAADLGRCAKVSSRCAFVVMPQHYREATTSPIEPMPVVV